MSGFEHHQLKHELMSKPSWITAVAGVHRHSQNTCASPQLKHVVSDACLFRPQYWIHDRILKQIYVNIAIASLLPSLLTENRQEGQNRCWGARSDLGNLVENFQDAWGILGYPREGLRSEILMLPLQSGTLGHFLAAGWHVVWTIM